MLSIVPIGTCRIHTPFRRAEAVHGIEVRRARNYGFTHTADEALQQLRFMRGELDFDPAIKPILFRPGSDAKMGEKEFVEPDIYVVEISSAKLTTVGDFAVQQNYLFRHFNEFFSDAPRTRKFWQLASGEDSAATSSWLDQQPAFLRLEDEDRQLLRAIRQKRQSLPELRAVMEKIVAITGKDRVVFVTHVNALNPDGKRIASRDALISAVETNGAAMGVDVYNPTNLMLAYDQRRAMEKGGLDLTHFTAAFSDQLVDDWNRTFLKGALSSSKVGDEERVLEEYSALIANDELFEASQMLRAAARSNANDLILRELARLEYRLGDYEAVVRLLSALDRSAVVDTDDQISLLVSLFKIGEYERASEIAERLLGDEVETPEITRYAALAAERSGKIDAAKAHWQRLFYNGDHEDEAGAAIISLLRREEQDAETRREWAEKVLAKNSAHSAALLLLWDLAIAAGDVDGCVNLLSRSRKLDHESTLTIADACVNRCWLAIAARIVSGAPRTNQIEEWVQQRSSEWLREGLRLLDDGDLAGAAQHIQGSWELSPRGTTVIRARRALERQFRLATRAAYNEHQYAEVLELASSAQSSFTEYPEMDAYAGRAAYRSGDFERAVDYLARATDDISPDVQLLQLLARAAVKINRSGVALDAYRMIIESPDATKKQVEASRKQIIVLGGRVLKEARLLSSTGLYAEAHSLLDKARYVDAIEDRVEREQSANLKALSRHIRGLDGDDNEERFSYSKLLFELDPESEFGAKSAAVAAMRGHRFADALEYFQHMRPLTANKEQVDRNISKCKLFLRRAT